MKLSDLVRVTVTIETVNPKDGETHLVINKVDTASRLLLKTASSLLTSEAIRRYEEFKADEELKP